MITIKCPQCGEQIEIDENGEGKAVCSVCRYVATLEKDAPSVYQKIIGQKADFEVKLKSYVEEYKQTGDAKDIHTVTESYEKCKALPCSNDIWFTFILDAVGVSVSRKDKELQTYLKNHARSLDSQIPDAGLFISILQSYPNVGTSNDWEFLIKQTHGDEAKFTTLTENILNYITKAKDKSFAMDIFNLIAAQESDWADAGRIYLRALLGSDEVAEKVFPRSAFNRRTKKFVLNVKSYCKKYLVEGSSITLEETKVWNNYTTACKRQKRRNIIVACVALVVAALVCVGTVVYLNATDKKTIDFNIDKVIEPTYGEDIDLTGYTVTYNKNSGAEVTKQITKDMLVGYNPELVGEQQTVSVEFEGVSKEITVRIKAATLATPVLTQSGNFVTWEYVPNAENYSVYIDSVSVPTATTASISYDLTDYGYGGQLSIYVRANAPSEKYNNSPLSSALVLTKLQPPSNLKYENGVLSWDEVSGASKYELSVNGNSYTSSVASLTVELAQGDNEITINAKAESQTVVSSVTSETVYHFRLDPVSSMSYKDGNVSWTAGENATSYDVYVDGVYWKNFGRNYFSVANDGFAEEYGETDFRTIGIICKSSITGTVASEMKSFCVTIGDRVWRDENALRWNGVGTGATYYVTVNGDNGRRLSLNSPYLSLSEVQWNVGDNTVEITAVNGSQDYICETITVTKLAASTVSVSGNGWITDGSATLRFKINGGEWDTELPQISSLAAGEYKITVKNVAATSATGFQIDSEETEINLMKLATPAVSPNKGDIVCNDYDSSKYVLKLCYSSSEDGTFAEISALSDIPTAGTYYVKAALAAAEGSSSGYDFIIPSEYSAAFEVEKLAAPSVSYTEGATSVTSDGDGVVKFYYVDNGEECELEGGLISNLPAGIFEIYARRIAQTEKQITSEATPADGRAKVFNMKITLTLSYYSQSQIYAVFGGCEAVDSLTISYEIKLYNDEGTHIGGQSESAKTELTKTAVSTDNIITAINYRASASFLTSSDGTKYTQTDVDKVELIVTIYDDSATQKLSATTTFPLTK